MLARNDIRHQVLFPRFPLPGDYSRILNMWMAQQSSFDLGELNPVPSDLYLIVLATKVNQKAVRQYAAKVCCQVYAFVSPFGSGKKVILVSSGRFQ